MHFLHPPLGTAALMATLAVHVASAAELPFQPLFNGRDFSGLDLYLGPDPATKKPLGLNKQDLADLTAFLTSLEEPKRRIRPPSIPGLDAAAGK